MFDKNDKQTQQLADVLIGYRMLHEDDIEGLMVKLVFESPAAISVNDMVTHMVTKMGRKVGYPEPPIYMEFGHLAFSLKQKGILHLVDGQPVQWLITQEMIDFCNEKRDRGNGHKLFVGAQYQTLEDVELAGQVNSDLPTMIGTIESAIIRYLLQYQAQPLNRLKKDINSICRWDTEYRQYQRYLDQMRDDNYITTRKIDQTVYYEVHPAFRQFIELQKDKTKMIKPSYDEEIKKQNEALATMIINNKTDPSSIEHSIVKFLFTIPPGQRTEHLDLSLSSSFALPEAEYSRQADVAINELHRRGVIGIWRSSTHSEYFLTEAFRKMIADLQCVKGDKGDTPKTAEQIDQEKRDTIDKNVALAKAVFHGPGTMSGDAYDEYLIVKDLDPFKHTLLQEVYLKFDPKVNKWHKFSNTIQNLRDRRVLASPADDNSYIVMSDYFIGMVQVFTSTERQRKAEKEKEKTRNWIVPSFTPTHDHALAMSILAGHSSKNSIFEHIGRILYVMENPVEFSMLVTILRGAVTFANSIVEVDIEDKLYDLMVEGIVERGIIGDSHQFTLTKPMREYVQKVELEQKSGERPWFNPNITQNLVFVRDMFRPIVPLVTDLRTQILHRVYNSDEGVGFSKLIEDSLDKIPNLHQVTIENAAKYLGDLGWLEMSGENKDGNTVLTVHLTKAARKWADEYSSLRQQSKFFVISAGLKLKPSEAEEKTHVPEGYSQRDAYLNDNLAKCFVYGTSDKDEQSREEYILVGSISSGKAMTEEQLANLYVSTRNPLVKFVKLVDELIRRNVITYELDRAESKWYRFTDEFATLVKTLTEQKRQGVTSDNTQNGWHYVTAEQVGAYCKSDVEFQPSESYMTLELHICGMSVSLDSARKLYRQLIGFVDGQDSNAPDLHIELRVFGIVFDYYKAVEVIKHLEFYGVAAFDPKS